MKTKKNTEMYMKTYIKEVLKIQLTDSFYFLKMTIFQATHMQRLMAKLLYQHHLEYFKRF